MKSNNKQSDGRKHRRKRGLNHTLMPINVGAISYLFAFAAFGLLTMLLAVSRRRQPLWRYLVLASGTSSLWSLAHALDASSEGLLPAPLLMVLELARTATWSLVMLKIIGYPRDEQHAAPGSAGRLQFYYLLLLSLSAAVLLLGPSLPLSSELLWRVVKDGSILSLISLSLAGLILIEHIYRHTRDDTRSSLTLLCLGLGAIFAYDFFMYAQALLYRFIDPLLWGARGIVNSFAVPLLAISIARNPE